MLLWAWATSKEYRFAGHSQPTATNSGGSPVRRRSLHGTQSSWELQCRWNPICFYVVTVIFAFSHSDDHCRSASLFNWLLNYPVLNWSNPVVHTIRIVSFLRLLYRCGFTWTFLRWTSEKNCSRCFQQQVSYIGPRRLLLKDSGDVALLCACSQCHITLISQQRKSSFHSFSSQDLTKNSEHSSKMHHCVCPLGFKRKKEATTWLIAVVMGQEQLCGTLRVFKLFAGKRGILAPQWRSQESQLLWFVWTHTRRRKVEGLTNRVMFVEPSIQVDKDHCMGLGQSIKQVKQMQQ